MGLYYTYFSDCTKIKVCGYDDNQSTHYAGSLVYDNGKFESASFGGGRLVGTNNGTDSEAHHFVTDHLGSTRVVAKVTSAGCEDLDRKDYYPFGKVWQQSGMPASGNRYTFSGKEQQRAGLASTKLLDFGARFYDPAGVTFLQQDPLLEKYYPIGQYNYCAGNPIKYMDLDGRKLYFASGVSESFKQKFSATVQYMNECGTAGDIAKLHGSDNIYYIDEATNIEGTQFNSQTRTISWDPNHLMETTDGKLISPATTLAHEADHAQKFDSTINSNDNEVKQQYNESVQSNSDKQYSKSEERRVITGTEQRAARKHGDINEKQTTRTNSKGKQANLNITDMKPKEISKYIYETNNQYQD